MLRSFVAVVLASALVAAAGCGKPMTDFTSAQYKFKAKFPGTPQEQAKVVQGITLNAFVTEGRSGAFMVGVADAAIPANVAAAEIEASFDEAQRLAVSNAGGTLKSSTKVTLAGKYPGREFSATLTKPVVGHMRMRIYYVGTRMYQVFALGKESFVSSADATTFFDSFTLTE